MHNSLTYSTRMFNKVTYKMNANCYKYIMQQCQKLIDYYACMRTEIKCWLTIKTSELCNNAKQKMQLCNNANTETIMHKQKNAIPK
jgi:hypothetical protein